MKSLKIIVTRNFFFYTLFTFENISIVYYSRQLMTGLFKNNIGSFHRTKSIKTYDNSLFTHSPPKNYAYNFMITTFD